MGLSFLMAGVDVVLGRLESRLVGLVFAARKKPPAGLEACSWSYCD